MALTYPERYSLAVSSPFQARIEVAIVKYAVYLQNDAAGGERGAWAARMLDSQADRIAEVERLRWYVVENVAAALALTVAGIGASLDTTATDIEIQSQIETRINTEHAA